VSSKSKAIKKESNPANKLSRRFNKLKVKPEHLKSRGIIYIGHLPKGFAEDELQKFFAQFGKITKIRVARSKKSGRPKGYAFLEFTDKDVAEIAVQTMHGYMMFHRQIECHMVDAAHKDTFKHGNREWKFVPTQVMFRNKKNAEKTPEQKAARVTGLLGKEKEKRIRLKELGIEYEFPGYQAIVDKAPAAKKGKKEAKVEKVESSPKKREAKAE
jgi:nucleolar protein 15